MARVQSGLPAVFAGVLSDARLSCFSISKRLGDGPRKGLAKRAAFNTVAFEDGPSGKTCTSYATCSGEGEPGTGRVLGGADPVRELANRTRGKV